MRADPNEWNNLAGDAQFADVKADIARWLPRESAPPAPGSISRLIEMKSDGIYWETKKIDAQAPLPGTVFETGAEPKPADAVNSKTVR